MLKKKNAFCPASLVKIIIALKNQPDKINKTKYLILGQRSGEEKRQPEKPNQMSQNQTAQISTVNREILKRH